VSKNKPCSGDAIREHKYKRKRAADCEMQKFRGRTDLYIAVVGLGGLLAANRRATSRPGKLRSAWL
jgi:hypothetical protein